MPPETPKTNNHLISALLEYDELIKEVRTLQARLIRLTAQRDDLVLHICPALQALYEEKLGCLEREILAAEMYIREKQRILEILRSQLNRQEDISYQEAEKKAADERQQYEEELEKKSKEAEDSRNRWQNSGWTDFYEDYDDDSQDGYDDWQDDDENSQDDDNDWQNDSGFEDSYSEGDSQDGSSSEDYFNEDDPTAEGAKKKSSLSQKIKTLYRKIIKKLHPDVNPDITEHEKELFLEAQRAYEGGDYKTLKRIWDELEGLEHPAEKYSNNPEDIVKLKELILKMTKLIETLQTEIADIRGSFPYTVKELLEDEQSLSKKQEELRKKLQDIRDANAYLEKFIEKIKEEIQKSSDSEKT